jgi:hypothetical protein
VPPANRRSSAHCSGVGSKPARARRKTETTEFGSMFGTSRSARSMRSMRAMTPGSSGSSASAIRSAYSPLPNVFPNAWSAS